jgi:hypothetical protein
MLNDGVCCFRVGDCTIRSDSVSNNPCTVSKVVKEMENATGPLSQFSNIPLNNPRSAWCSRKTYRTVDTMFKCSDDADMAWPKPRDPSAASMPDATPMVCMRRRTTSSGYVRVCAERPEMAPAHWIFSMVVADNKEPAVADDPDVDPVDEEVVQGFC